MVCDSDETMMRSEFTLLFIKFARNPKLRGYLEFIDRIVGKILDFDGQKYFDRKSPFFEMIDQFKSTEELITGPEVTLLQKLIKEKINKEQRRVLAVKSDDSKYTGQADKLRQLSICEEIPLAGKQ